MRQPIPKRIIQTGKSRTLPLEHQAAVVNLKLLNPDFEYLYFDDQDVESFIAGEFPQYAALFNSFPFRIQRYDFFRYLAVYRLGGFYFDMDVFLAAGLEDLRASGCVFPFEGLTFSRFLRSRCGMDWQIGNYAFGAAANHPFLRAVVDNCIKAQQNPGWIQPMMKGVPPLSRTEFLVLSSTGPGLLSRTFAEAPDLAADVTVLFSEDVCDYRTWNRFGDFGIHLMTGSWHAKRGFLTQRIARIWEARVMRRLIAESRKLGPKRKSPAILPTHATSQKVNL